MTRILTAITDQGRGCLRLTWTVGGFRTEKMQTLEGRYVPIVVSDTKTEIQAIEYDDAEHRLQLLQIYEPMLAHAG